MGSKIEVVEELVQKLQGTGEIVYKKMFGEFGLYCDEKYFANVCDDQFFVKITDNNRAEALALGAEEAPPYAGAKPYFRIAEIDDKEKLRKLVRVTVNDLPPAKKKK